MAMEHRTFDAIPIRKSKCSNVGAFAQLAGRSVVGHWPLERPLSQAAAKLGVPCTNKRTSTATSKFWAGVPHHMIKLSQAIKQKECPPGGSVCHEQTCDLPTIHKLSPSAQQTKGWDMWNGRDSQFHWGRLIFFFHRVTSKLIRPGMFAHLVNLVGGWATHPQNRMINDKSIPMIIAENHQAAMFACKACGSFTTCHAFG